VTIIIWVKIVHKSLLRVAAGGLNKYTTKDKEYTITAAPMTISKFGPSGSLKNTNIKRESTRDVKNKISNDIFLDLRYIL
jgi:hypothetical protein